MKQNKTPYRTYEESQNVLADRSVSNQINYLEDNQKPTLINYRNHLALKGLSKATLRSYITIISLLLRHTGKTAEDLTKEDITNYLLSKQNQNQRTRLTHFLAINLFLRWLKKEDCIKDIQMKNCLHIKLPEEMLTLEEIKRMVQVATNFRDKALIFSLYETAARKGELLNLKIKHITFDENGAVIIFPTGKTGSRRLRVIDCVPDLKRWIETHPARDDPEAPLWINISCFKDKTMGKSRLETLLKTVANRAGIKKNIYPHLFRHSRLTELTKQGFNEAELRIIAGWSADSTTPKVYIHLSGADVERKILEKHGLIDKKEESTKVLRHINCWRCKERNGAAARFCSRCGADLDEEKRKQDRMTLIKETKDIDVTNAEEMIELLKRLIEEKRIPTK